MLKRLGILAGNLFLGGCAAVNHSDRRDYRGPVVKPVCSRVRCCRSPVRMAPVTRWPRVPAKRSRLPHPSLSCTEATPARRSFGIDKDGVLHAMDGPAHEQWAAKAPVNVPFLLWSARPRCTPTAGCRTRTGWSRAARDDRVFHGLKSASGERRWESHASWKYDRWITEGGQLFVFDGKPHALLNDGGGTSPDSWLTAVDLRTGDELWRSEVAPLATFTLPAAGDGMVVTGSEPFDSGSPRCQACGPGAPGDRCRPSDPPGESAKFVVSEVGVRS